MTPDEWQAVLGPMDGWAERHVLAAFGALGLRSPYLDVGCGTGAMANMAHRLGIEAVGVDRIGPLHGEEWLRRHDLRDPLDLGQRFALVTSLEVAEHIPSEHDATFCDSVARHVADGGLLVFTAAHPGQGGEEHVNCRPASYWRTMFHDRGLSWSREDSLRLALVWSWLGSPCYWLAANVQVFTR